MTTVRLAELPQLLLSSAVSTQEQLKIAAEQTVECIGATFEHVKLGTASLNENDTDTQVNLVLVCSTL